MKTTTAKCMAILVLVGFIWFVVLPEFARSEQVNSIQKKEEGGAPLLEKEKKENPVSIKKKKFPWLLVVAGVVVIGVAVYFVTAKKKNGSVDVKTTPDGASIFLDDVDTGKKTDAILEGVKPGTHTVTLKLVGYTDYTTPVMVESGKTAIVSKNLELAFKFVAKWGTEGSGEGEFLDPNGIVVDGSGYCYVVDSGNNRVQKFTSSGQYVGKWGRGSSMDGGLLFPNHVALDSVGNVYVSDLFNNRVSKFTSSGVFLAKYGEGRPGGLKAPFGVAVYGSMLHVAERDNHCLSLFDLGGSFVRSWSSQGSGDGYLNKPNGIKIDQAGNVYVVDTENHRVQKFSSSGVFLAKIGSKGYQEGQFLYPQDVALDSAGDLFVSDGGNCRIQKFSSSGGFIATWGDVGVNNGQFKWPMGICFDNQGYLYVVDSENSRVQKFCLW